MTKHNLIILHGWGHNRGYWQQFANSLSDSDIKVTTLDLPGFGEEELIDDWGIPEYAQWVKSKITEKKLNNVILLGHSFGGRISSLIASDNPSWLKGLILYASPSIYRPTEITSLKNKLASISRKIGFSSQLIKSEELKEAEKLGLGVVFRKIVNFDQTKVLPRIKTPTLIIWGEKDTEVPFRVGREINALIPNSKLLILDGLGHNAHLENPNIFYGTIKRYLETL